MSRLVLSMIVLVVAAPGCWSSQDSGKGSGDADTDADTDADADSDADSDSDSDGDTDTDTDADTDTESDTEPCLDPCLDTDSDPIAGCLDPCGGMPDPEPQECPEQGDFVCLGVNDIDDAPGMCIPTGAADCEQDSACECFPDFPVCDVMSQETVWFCAEWGMCTATCEM